jgi:hypothetical protein
MELTTAIGIDGYFGFFAGSHSQGCTGNMFNAEGSVKCIGLCTFLHLVTGTSSVVLMRVIRTDGVQFFFSSTACVYVCAAMPGRACRQCLATAVCQNGCVYGQRPWTLSYCCAVCRWASEWELVEEQIERAAKPVVLWVIV